MSNTRKPKAAPPPATGDAGAVRVCERGYDAWFACRGSSDTETALSVFAAFLLADGGIDTKRLLASTDEQITQGIREVWSWFWVQRPDLCNLCAPMAGWINEEKIPADMTRAIGALARAAVNAGITGLLGDAARDMDLLGHAYVTMRPKSARDARGEFYTPPHVCEVIGEMIVAELAFESRDGPLRPGMSIAEPAAGTGGMVRAFAEVLRRKDLDPADFWWVVNDISPLVVAALAVNCHVWGLGPNVVIAAADSLAEPDWPDRAWETQRGAIAHRDEMLHHAQILALLKGIDRTLDGAGGLATPADTGPEPDPIPGPVPEVPDVELPPDGALFDAEELATQVVRPASRARRRPAVPDPDGEGDALALF